MANDLKQSLKAFIRVLLITVMRNATSSTGESPPMIEAPEELQPKRLQHVMSFMLFRPAPELQCDVQSGVWHTLSKQTNILSENIIFFNISLS